LTTTTPTTTEQTVATTVYVAPVTTPLVQAVETTVAIVPMGTTTTTEVAQSIETTSPPTSVELKPKIDTPLTTDMRLPETMPSLFQTVASPTSINGLPVLRPNTTATTLIVLEPISSSESTPPTSLSIQQENLPNISTQLTQESLFNTVAGKNNLVAVGAVLAMLPVPNLTKLTKV
jgi:hypothetical protein